MGNQMSLEPADKNIASEISCRCEQSLVRRTMACPPHELELLAQEVRCLRRQLQELQACPAEATPPDPCELERDFNERIQAYRNTEECLRWKKEKLEECVREEACAAKQKLDEMLECQEKIKCALVRLSKEHSDLYGEHKTLAAQYMAMHQQCEGMGQQEQPVNYELEKEKKRKKCLEEKANYMRRMQQLTETSHESDKELLRQHMQDMEKSVPQAKEANAELKSKLANLKKEVANLSAKEKENEQKLTSLEEELRSKEEDAQRLVEQLEAALAENWGRFQRDAVKGLRMARDGLANALRNTKDCKLYLLESQRIVEVGRQVKKLANKVLDEEDANSIASVPDELQPPLAASTPEGNLSAEQVPDGDALNEQTEENAETELDATQEMTTEAEDTTAQAGEEDTVPDDEGNDDVTMTVGMALMPELVLDPRYSRFKKKPIVEVPSVWRKLQSAWQSEELELNEPTVPTRHSERSEPTELTELTDLSDSTESADYFDAETGLEPSETRTDKPVRRPRIRHRFIIYNHYRTSLQSRVRRIISTLTGARRARKSKVVSIKVNISQTQVLHQTVSYHSLVPVVVSKVDISTDTRSEQEQPVWTTDASMETGSEPSHPARTTTFDKGIDVYVDRNESSVQVTEELYSESLLDVVPPQTRSFVYFLQSSVSQTDSEAAVFTVKLCRRWQTDEEFRRGLDILQAIATPGRMEIAENASKEVYDRFVSAMNSLDVLKDIFKPQRVPMLNQIEEQVDEQLVNYHRRKMEDEYVCTVYYKVPRVLSH